ncbi:MAG: thiamine pyrophosphate-dependent enzyme [Gemmatimonadetes bacterium]|nr:thiamine pyrophosphate-dependent enzyme [Gemmatimonadota bacterium]
MQTNFWDRALVLTRAQLLDPLARLRTNEVVVTTMSVTRPWGRISDHDLDFASADSAMGHAADLALGIALARPDRRVICLNGDGSMLMTLGTLATVIGTGVTNLILFVVDNGTYEITGNQPLAAAARLDHGAMARAAGWTSVHRFDDPRAYVTALPSILAEPGPTFVHVLVEPGTEWPIGRTPSEEARYLRVSLAEWSLVLKAALAADPRAGT